jgi:NADPH2:quinone reductase
MSHPSSPTTMQAMLVDRQDGAFQLANLPLPTPGAGEVLVRIHASAINPLDTKIRAGAAAHARHPLPAVLGIDMAGVVVAVGANVGAFRPGDEVYGMTGGVGGVQGSLAEYAAVDADLLALKPPRLTMREAASLPLVAITAWEGLVDRAHVAPGMRVLVQGGAGGVGSVAVQIARALGAQVFASDRSGRRAEIENLGATFVDANLPIAEQLARDAGGQPFDTVYDTVGGPVLDASFALIKRFGHVVSCLGWGTHALAPLSFKAGTYSGVFTLLPLLTGEGRAHHGEILAEVASLVQAGRLLPKLDPRQFALVEAEAAHRAVTDRSAVGKVVVDVA